MKLIDNLKGNIKRKLRMWLEIDSLQNQLIEHKDKTSRNIFKVEKRLDEQRSQIEALNRTLQSVVSLGVDVVPNYDRGSGSWAVVCIESNRGNVVKFIDLHGQDYRYIMDVLKQFECSRRVIDTPHIEMFEDIFVFK